MFKVLNQEFTFDVDLSLQASCGLNGAVYFSETQADGGMASNPTNKAGANYGAGYYGSQWPRDLKFIGSKASSYGWIGTSTNSGVGNYGFCCNEMDVWVDNSISTAYTPHPCDPVGPYNGVCDPDGCDFNPYRQGDYGLYGPGKRVDITHFITDSGTATDNLKEIRRLYIHNGVIIANAVTQTLGIPASNAITQGGGVLVLPIWDDCAVNVLWLNSYFPPDCTGYGCEHGACPGNSSVPSEAEVSAVSTTVTYSNIHVGDIGSTYSGSTPGSTTTTSATTSTSSSSSSTRNSTTTTTTTTITTTTANGATETRWDNAVAKTGHECTTLSI
ncbi:hypothetical protein FRC04_000528 [Tulasnella sp. 424]|nr:hypothetical protein FRC04_000528 [Tulasnella sp. 424]